MVSDENRCAGDGIKNWKSGFEDTVIMLGVRIRIGSLMVSD